jgi:hypothetical protein
LKDRHPQVSQPPSRDLMPYQNQAPFVMPEVHVHTGRDRRRGGILGTVAKGALLGGVALVALDKLDIIDLPDFPQFDLGSDPEYAFATVDQNSYELEVDFDIRCTQRVSVGVDVEAFKNGPVGDGVFKKKIFGDFLLCSNENEIESNAVATEDPVSGQITRVVVELSGVYIEQPRVDHLDIRNCVDLDPGDSMEEIQADLDAYYADAADGDTPGCDDGFTVTQIAGSSDLAEAKDIGWKAAQLAMTLDTNPIAFIEQADAQLREAVEAQLRAQVRFINAEIEVRIVRPDDTATVQGSIDRIAEDLRAQFTVIEFGTDEKGDYIYVEDGSGAHATVHFTGFVGLEVQELTVTEAEVEANPDCQPTLTIAQAGTD